MKQELESKYNVVNNNLLKAIECLKKAERILDTDFVINNKGYKTQELYNKINELRDYRGYVTGRIFSAIKKM